MADRRSALAHLPASPPAHAALTLHEIRPGSIVQIAAWPDTLEAVQATISELLRVRAPRMGSGAVAAGVALLAVAPGRFLVSADAASLAEAFESAIAPSEGAVTDLSHGRAILRLQGKAAAATLAKCIALDLDSGAFPPGRVAQTAIHHIDVMIFRRAEDVFDLWVLRGFAEALAEWLLDAGVELGIGFGKSAAR